jgi:hypothetical protein
VKACAVVWTRLLAALGGVTMHCPGTIIGKALEALDKDTGEILVLLSLQ